jgi:hypothetical protein
MRRQAILVNCILLLAASVHAAKVDVLILNEDRDYTSPVTVTLTPNDDVLEVLADAGIHLRDTVYIGNGATSYSLPLTDYASSGALLMNNGSNALVWSAVTLGGDVVGPGSATDNAFARFNSTTGKLIQNGVVLGSDTGEVTGVTSITLANGISHTGDTHTLIEFTAADTITAIAGGVDSLGTYINSSAADRDFEVQTDNGDEALKVDGGNNTLQIDAVSTTQSGYVALTEVYSFDVAGDTFRDLQIRNDGTLGYNSSTRAKKRNIRDAPSADTARLLNLRVAHYNRPGREAVETGLIAEEVAAVYPEAVSPHRVTGEPETVVKSALIVPMLHLIQQQQAQIDALTARIEALEGN